MSSSIPYSRVFSGGGYSIRFYTLYRVSRGRDGRLRLENGKHIKVVAVGISLGASTR